MSPLKRAGARMTCIGALLALHGEIVPNVTDDAAAKLILYHGASDTSAAVALDERTILVGDDETNALRSYAVDGGSPLSSHDLTSFLALADERPEADIEGAARVGERVYWITSHGRNKNGKPRPDRYHFFATEIRVSPAGLEISGMGTAYRGLAEALAGDPTLQHLRLAEATRLGDTPSDRKERKRLAPKAEGLNIEGLCATPDGATLYLGLRNPLATDPSGGFRHAIVIPLENPAGVVERAEAPTFGPPLLWDLEGLAIRDMVHASRAAAFFIVAGPTDDGPGFALYRWSGEPAAAPFLLRRLDADGAGWQPEALVAFEGSSRLLALSDDGTLGRRVADESECRKGGLRADGTCPNKRLREESRRSFRGLWLEP